MSGTEWKGEGSARDVIPEHYAGGGGLEPWHIWEAFNLDPWSASAVKYILRAGKKGPAVTDLRKAQHCLQYLIEKEEAAEAAKPKIEVHVSPSRGLDNASSDFPTPRAARYLQRWHNQEGNKE